MGDGPADQADAASDHAASGFYTFTDERAQVEYVGGRRAAQWVPFLLPHLRPGMRLLDVGCGVGSITLDLAELVAPGAVVGVDMDEAQLRLAREAATARGLTNARFEVGSVFELPCADASFDVALAHTLLFHLSDQPRALRELRRALAPGGLVAVSDDYFGAWAFAPEDSPVRRLVTEIVPRVVAAAGGSPYYSPRLRGLLLEAGFVRAEGHAVATEQYGTLAETRRYAAIIDRMLRNPELTEFMMAQSLVMAEELPALRAAVRAWGERSDAFAAVLYCAALGWVEVDASGAPSDSAT
ncbi:MAG TPA: class I SAM-dependent methyltransferase [Ktedonobacterales bacterium]